MGYETLSRFSEYAEVMIWIENVARQPHQSFTEIVQKFEDKVAELNFRYSINYLLERLRTERASYWDYNGGWWRPPESACDGADSDSTQS
jgi:hypothetical protein